MRQGAPVSSLQINEARGRVLGADKIVLPPDGKINIGEMVENFKAFARSARKKKKKKGRGL